MNDIVHRIQVGVTASIRGSLRKEEEQGVRWGTNGRGSGNLW